MAADDSCHDSLSFDLEMDDKDMIELCESLLDENSSNSLSYVQDNGERAVTTPHMTDGKTHSYSTPATELSCTPPLDENSIRSRVQTPSHIFGGLSLHTPKHLKSGDNPDFTSSFSGDACAPIALRPDSFSDSTNNNNIFASLPEPPLLARSSTNHCLSGFLPIPHSPIRCSPDKKVKDEDNLLVGRQQMKAPIARPNTKRRKLIKQKTSSTITSHHGQKPQKPPTATKKPCAPTNKKSCHVFVDVRNTDVLFGRGGRSNHNTGNQNYLRKVREKAIDYANASTLSYKQQRPIKKRITEEVLSYIQDECNGRFLKMDPQTDRWYVEDANIAYRKVRQALHDQSNHVSFPEEGSNANV